MTVPGFLLGERMGAGTGGVVYRGRSIAGIEAAIKIATGAAPGSIAHEAAILARVQRRWGPALLASGEDWLALEWIAGTPLDPDDPGEVDRIELAAIVAHGVGRALDELHRSGVRHGDVKPANILVHAPRPAVDRASDRGVTLVDLDLAADVTHDELLGGTPRYLAPEQRASTPSQVSTPAADLYALGLVLEEILAPCSQEQAASEMATLARAMLAHAPGARPSAAFVADAAARVLALGCDRDEVIAERKARIRRTQLAARGSASTLDDLGVSRWLVALVGADAARWPPLDDDEATLALGLAVLAETAAPEAWTYDEVRGGVRGAPAAVEGDGPALWVALARGLASARPTEAVLARAEDEVSRATMGRRRAGTFAAAEEASRVRSQGVNEQVRRALATLAFDLASALFRRGEVGRAFAALAHASAADPAVMLLHAEIARRRGDGEAALAHASAAGPAARPLVARLAWDRGAIDEAEASLGDASGAAAAEMRALIAYARGAIEQGLAAIAGVDAAGLVRARLDGVRGMLEHARGNAAASAAAFQAAVDRAAEAGAVVEEATYLTGLAAAAVDAGRVASALSSSTRAALLWERLERPALATRAHLSRAAAFALIGASHEAELAAREARARAGADRRAEAYARWAIVESRLPGDPLAADEARAAFAALMELPDEDDRTRAAARVLVWAPGTPVAVDAIDAAVAARSGAARWEWWGARAATPSASPRAVSEIVALLDVPAPLGSRGPALATAAQLARQLGDGEAVRRLEAARRLAVRALKEGAPPAQRAALSAVPWLEGIADDDERAALGAAQVGELESIVRALSSRDRLKPLLEQVLDTMVLWTGVERGLLLLRAPDGRLVPRAARNLARRDLDGEQLHLSTSLAQRAIASRAAVLATDAFTQVGDLHSSVHALGLRSVLAVPLVARGDVLGVVYLDDRVRRGAFGPGELAWVRLVASQAALAIADARDQVLLRRAVRRAERANARLAAELGAVRAELSATTETRYRYDEIGGRSEPMRLMLKLVDRVTTSDVPVLLIGESGTGKELVARAIHKNGPRGARAFVSENCASVPEALLESTLFGHVRGAFTGASATRAGLFDVADKGTLFLDEIGEMPLAMQTKLLRVLQNGEVRPVGGERSRIVDVRIIGATHRDLEAMVAAGTFREDLFYRLNVVSLRVPPLRERREDIPLLATRLLEKHANGKKVKLTRAALDRLTAFPWPGNVRQLENEIRRALVLADERVDVSELSEEVSRGGPAAARDAGMGLKARVDALEVELVKDALQKTKGNQTRAAELLGVSRFGLQKMMRRLGIKPP